MKIVIAADSFKGSLTSNEVAAACAEAIYSVIPSADVIYLPVGDGGEGTAEALISSLNGEHVECEAHDALGRKISTEYGIANFHGLDTAIIDMAAASGLPLIAEQERDIMSASTFGSGEMLLDACRKGCRNFIFGLGGSATCDAGMGLLSSIGILFKDASGQILSPSGAALCKIASIHTDSIQPSVRESKFTIISDVTNPLFGPTGAAHVYAPQKGASPEEVVLLDEGLRRIAEISSKYLGSDYSEYAGAGAAGGLGFAFKAFLNAELRSGVDTVLDLIDFDEIIAGADLVITGEGKIDAQTLYGKLPSGIARRAEAKGIPTIAIAGRIEDEDVLLNSNLFSRILCITPPEMSITEAMCPETARTNIATTIRHYLRQI